MKRIFTAAIAAAALALSASVPARATTFPGLTLIYIVSGAIDSGNTTSQYATSVLCTNNSGQSATIRWRFFYENGVLAGTYTSAVAHSNSLTVSTQNTAIAEVVLDTGVTYFQGMAAVYSTQSGVFCTAILVDPSVLAPQGIDLHMIRFNPHPGAVE